MGRYSIILADPPWKYNNRGHHNKTKFGGGVHSHYPVMKPSDILALRPAIDTLAADNSALFLWVVMPQLQLGLEVMKAWGYRYVTNAFTWVKTTKKGEPIGGPGFYTASNAEICLLGVRGKLKPVNHLVNSVILEPRREHSRKPDVVRDRIVRVFGDLPRIELFARQAAEGWDAIGNQLNGLDIRGEVPFE